MRWVFDEKGNALNRDHVTKFTWTLDGVSGKYIVQAHQHGPASPSVLYRVETASEAREAIKDLVQGREPRAEWTPWNDAEHR